MDRSHGCQAFISWLMPLWEAREPSPCRARSCRVLSRKLLQRSFCPCRGLVSPHFPESLWHGPLPASSGSAPRKSGWETPQADGIFLRRSRNREENQLLWVGGAVLCITFLLYGDNPRRSMRCIGKNLRPQLLNATFHRARKSDLNFGLHFAAY